jgi:hypothetical protein
VRLKWMSSDVQFPCRSFCSLLFIMVGWPTAWLTGAEPQAKRHVQPLLGALFWIADFDHLCSSVTTKS